MPITARDIMETQVVTLSPYEQLVKVERLFFEEEIHGAPVVADDGRLLGMVGSLDLLRAAAEDHDALQVDFEPSPYLRELVDFSEFGAVTTRSSFQERLGERVVSDLMSEGAVTVSLDTPVPEIARTLRENRTHRVLVTEQGELRGIISTFDLVELLEQQP
jgi:CBS domain-containing protein